MFSSPEKNISLLHIGEGARVADFGTGSGAYALALAHKVGRSGRVFAIDVQRDLLTTLKNSAASKKIFNIEYIVGNLDLVGGSRLASGSVDAVVISNILFQSEHKEGLLGEAKRILKAGGQMLLVDWSGSFGSMGPNAAHVVTEPIAISLAEKVGFIFERSTSAGNHHYALVFHT